MTTALDHANKVHDFLRSASAYPDPTSQVQLKETHISWVYLTDRYVYKQKKPVRFEFLDFSTPELRKFYCEQEVTLNKRFSPDVYHGVIPVSCDAAGKYRLNQKRNVVEYVVKMTRLDETNTLEHLILNNELTAEHVDRLSNALTSFYSSQAPAMLRSQEFLKRLKDHVFANRNDLLESLANADEEPAVQFATNAQLRCLTLESDYFLQRVADGRVVDGHGDLRPEHVYFRRYKPTIIDCIEFNAEYRTNDVIDELAFLSMECDRLGNHDIGKSLLKAYQKAGFDEARPFLTVFYKCYRACVRAKVAALRATQMTEQQRSESMAMARTYMGLSRQYAEKLGSSVVVMVGGMSGTGKSTLAAALQDPLAAEILQTDVIRNELFTPSNYSGNGNGKYTFEARRRVYDAMIDRIGGALSRSPTVILDGTFSSTASRRTVCDKAAKLGAKVLQVQCECPAEVAEKRIADRIAAGNSPSEATSGVYLKQGEEYEPVVASEPIMTVNTTLAEPTQVEDVVAMLRDMIHH